VPIFTAGWAWTIRGATAPAAATAVDPRNARLDIVVIGDLLQTAMSRPH
jgi:hypothetical protein